MERYQNLPQVGLDAKSVLKPARKEPKVIKPQISKEYASALVLGRPDLSILEAEFERGPKFYEPQYADTNVDIRFREIEG